MQNASKSMNLCYIIDLYNKIIKTINVSFNIIATLRKIFIASSVEKDNFKLSFTPEEKVSKA